MKEVDPFLAIANARAGQKGREPIEMQSSMSGHTSTSQLLDEFELFFRPKCTAPSTGPNPHVAQTIVSSPKHPSSSSNTSRPPKRTIQSSQSFNGSSVDWSEFDRMDFKSLERGQTPKMFTNHNVPRDGSNNVGVSSVEFCNKTSDVRTTQKSLKENKVLRGRIKKREKRLVRSSTTGAIGVSKLTGSGTSTIHRTTPRDPIKWTQEKSVLSSKYGFKKLRVEWELEINGRAHTVRLFHGHIGGKRLIEVDGQCVMRCKKVIDSGSLHDVNIDGNVCIVQISIDGDGQFTYDLQVPCGVTFEDAKLNWLSGLALSDGRWGS